MGDLAGLRDRDLPRDDSPRVSVRRGAGLVRRRLSRSGDADREWDRECEGVLEGDLLRCLLCLLRAASSAYRSSASRLSCAAMRCCRPRWVSSAWLSRSR